MRLFRTIYIVVIAALVYGVYATNQPVAIDAPALPQSPSKVDKAFQSKLRLLVEDKSADYAIAVQELNGQKRVARVSASTPMVTASTYKLYVAYATLHKIEQGKATLQTRLSNGQTVGGCLEVMIIESDNTCGRALGFFAGWSDTEKLLATKNITRTYLNNYDSNDMLLTKDKTSTAQAHVSFLRQLERGQLLTTSHTKLLLGYMKDQRWRERIPAGVPENVDVADKPGWLIGVQNDAAIVYGPKSTYVVVILSNGNSTSSLKDISAEIYGYLQS